GQIEVALGRLGHALVGWLAQREPGRGLRLLGELEQPRLDLARELDTDLELAGEREHGLRVGDGLDDHSSDTLAKQRGARLERVGEAAVVVELELELAGAGE